MMNSRGDRLSICFLELILRVALFVVRSFVLNFSFCLLIKGEMGKRIWVLDLSPMF